MARPKNDTFLRALLRQPVEYTPVWLMRQAGRYLPEYCETRKRAGSFLSLCKNPRLACEVTLQPLARYELDAAILFSDILTVPDAMGLGLYFAEGEGPKFERPLRDDDAISEQYFFSRLQSFVRADDVLIAETGTSGQNTVGLDLPVPLRYINQSSWGSIGYALPALLGACAASPERRHILCTGDGSFQVTVQELSTIIRCGFAPVVFLLNNRGYTIERAILGRHSDYNDVVNWTYVDVPRVFGIDEDNYLSRVCETRSGLESALRDAADAKSLAFIEVQLEALDMPPATAAVGDFTRRFDYGEYGPANK